jgi:hypothetical protein
MGNGEGAGQGPAYVTDMHTYPHLREATDRAGRTNLERFTEKTALRQSPRSIVTIHILHRTLDDLAPVRRGVDDVAAA